MNDLPVSIRMPKICKNKYLKKRSQCGLTVMRRWIFYKITFSLEIGTNCLGEKEWFFLVTTLMQ